MNIDIYNKVPDCQNKIYYEPDSSPLAYEFYQRIYEQTFGKIYDLSKPHFMVYENKLYYDRLQSTNNRLQALFKETVPVDSDKDGNNAYRFQLRLAGETDFDFKFDDNPYKDKAGKLIKIAGEDQKIKKKLEEHYSERHHTLVNFSLMFVPGDLQKIKSRGILSGKDKKYEWLDRLDSFLYILDCYYRCKDTSFFKEMSGANFESLKEFLNEFENVENYCKIVYLLEDTNLIKALIQNGKKTLATKEDIEQYLELADRFWEEKASHIKLTDN